MPNKMRKNPDQPRKQDQTSSREETQDDREPQRRDGGMSDENEQIDEPDNRDTQRVSRGVDEPSGLGEQSGDEEVEVDDGDFIDEEEPADEGGADRVE
jgi:hypothetical protein